MLNLNTTYDDAEGAEWELSVEYQFIPGSEQPYEPGSIQINEIYRKELVSALDVWQWVDFWDGYIDEVGEDWSRLENECMKNYSEEK